ncbi:MAG: hypothetical protein CVU07_00470 [Bacteroidetes bacterium HGW-Bacteroidetes-23]|nr:MAG: hypothetical protein CVU07_00470 [Bacteroidetes bacterium HGW-Bacteroidetes-23]
MIEIQNENKHTKEEFIDLLLDQKIQPFKIYIPKTTKLFFSSTEDIAEDYLKLAIVGQLLKDFADEFDYTFVPPETHSSVLFTIKTKRFDELANELLLISYFYGNESFDEDDFFEDTYFEIKDDFLESIKNQNFKVACKECLDVYLETIGNKPQ